MSKYFTCFVIGILLNGIHWRFKTGMTDDVMYPIILLPLFIIIFLAQVMKE